MSDTRRRAGLHAFDLRGITNREHKHTVQGALNACDYPLTRIRRNTGKRVPVTVADTSRFSSVAAAHDAGADALIVPEVREAALGLYWLPTAEHPAGRIEVGLNAIDDVQLAQEVMLAEVWHAIDYGVPLTDAQRQAIFAIVHGGDATLHGTHGWFEERGGQDYWADWVGEVGMSLFLRTFAPSLSRPLEARQPWTHRVNDDMTARMRAVLL